MNPTNPTPSDLPCNELVQLITAYLDDTLPADTRTEIDQHLESCSGCRTVIDQWRTTIDLTGRLTEADVQNADPLTRHRLQSTFRGLRRR